MLRVDDKRAVSLYTRLIEASNRRSADDFALRGGARRT